MKHSNKPSNRIPFLRYTKMAIFALVLILATTSCSKSSDDEEEGNGNGYFISFKANGTSIEYKPDDFMVASFVDDGTYFLATFAGVGRSSAIQFQAHDHTAIVEKEYSGYFVKQATQTPAYVIGASISFSQLQVTHSTPDKDPDVNVTIDEITATTVRGSFSGTLKSKGKDDVNITKGKFFIPRNNV